VTFELLFKYDINKSIFLMTISNCLAFFTATTHYLFLTKTYHFFTQLLTLSKQNWCVSQAWGTQCLPITHIFFSGPFSLVEKSEKRKREFSAHCLALVKLS